MSISDAQRFHRPGDRYVRAMPVLQEVDYNEQPCGVTVALATSRKVGALALAQVGEVFAYDLLAQVGGAALHELTRDTPQAKMVSEFQHKLYDKLNK
jgi:hypothetical protein